MSQPTPNSLDAGRVLLTGATGFVGRAVYPELRRAGFDVRCTTRDPGRAARQDPGRAWVTCDVNDEASIETALSGCDLALYLVHGMASGDRSFRAHEVAQAERFSRAAAHAGVRRVVYLGGVAPPDGRGSDHLQSRIEVGEVLRAGAVPAIELRASMIIGRGSLSWLIVRDLAARLPVMVLPRWLTSRTEPVAVEDVVAALVGALRMQQSQSAWFDIPGPEALSGREILDRTASILGLQHPRMIEVPFLTPRLSSWWVRLVTRAEWSVAREVVVGLTDDLLARDDRFWGLIDRGPRIGFDEAARRAVVDEQRDGPLAGPWGAVERTLQRAARAT